MDFNLIRLIHSLSHSITLINNPTHSPQSFHRFFFIAFHSPSFTRASIIFSHTSPHHSPSQVSSRIGAAARTLARSMLTDRLAHLFDRRATLEQLLASNVLQTDPRQSTKTSGAATAVGVASALQSTQVRCVCECNSGMWDGNDDFFLLTTFFLNLDRHLHLHLLSLSLSSLSLSLSVFHSLTFTLSLSLSLSLLSIYFSRFFHDLLFRCVS